MATNADHAVARLAQRIEEIHLAYTSGEPKDGDLLRMAVLRAMTDVYALRERDAGPIWQQYVGQRSAVAPLLLTWYADPSHWPGSRETISMAIMPNDNLAGIVARLGKEPSQLVAEVNGEQVPPDRWPSLRVSASDRITLHPR